MSSQTNAPGWAERMLRTTLATVFPRTCVVCGRSLTDSEQYMCAHCYLRLPRTDIHRMSACRVTDMMARLRPGVRLASWFFYSRGADFCNIIYDNKYHHCPRVGRLAGADFARELQAEGYFDGVDLLVPIPIHWCKRLTRGYNQAEMVARGVSAVTGLPVVNVLRMRRHHTSQTRFGRKERMANITADNFCVHHPEQLAGKHILIVDDVITTGATMTAAVAAVTAAAPDVRAVSLLSLGLTELL